MSTLSQRLQYTKQETIDILITIEAQFCNTGTAPLHTDKLRIRGNYDGLRKNLHLLRCALAASEEFLRRHHTFAIGYFVFYELAIYNV